MVATFCIRYHKEYGTEDRSVKEIFQTKNFQNVLSLAQISWGEAPTPAIKLGQYIKEVLIVFKQDAIFENDADRKTECENFYYLVDTKWNQVINAPHIRKLKEQKAKVVEMPITSDITTFLQYLDGEILRLVKELSQDRQSDTWKQLNKTCLGYLIIFNRRREGEVSQLALETYTQRLNYRDCESDVLRQTMSTMENILSDTYSYMTTRGKRNRMVPIVYASEIRKALDILVKY